MSVVLVTGSSSGIGLATALLFARGGARVFATTRASSSTDELMTRARDEGLPLEHVELDVTSDDSVSTAVAGILDRAGHIDVLVNNAGISLSASVEDARMSDAKRIFEVNYFGAIRMVRAVLPSMRQRGDGRIINVSSISGRAPVPVLGHYGASKFALESVSESLAHEVAGLGIKVVVVEPGTTRTPMFTRRKNLRPIDPKSPYMPHIRRLYGYFGEAMKQALEAEQVAQTIVEAATSESPRFRYLMGRDALGLVRAHEHSTDEERIEIAKADDEEFAAFMNERAGIDLY